MSACGAPTAAAPCRPIHTRSTGVQCNTARQSVAHPSGYTAPPISTAPFFPIRTRIVTTGDCDTSSHAHYLTSTAQLLLWRELSPPAVAAAMTALEYSGTTNSSRPTAARTHILHAFRTATGGRVTNCILALLLCFMMQPIPRPRETRDARRRATAVLAPGTSLVHPRFFNYGSGYERTNKSHRFVRPPAVDKLRIEW